MSYNDKVESARTILIEHNTNIGEGEEGKVDIDKFFSKLKASGGTTESSLSECTWEDLEDCGLPKILARKIANLFRRKETSVSTTTEYLSPKKADRLPLGEMVAYLDPEDATNAVARRIKEVVGQNPFMVFKNGRILDVENTKKLLLDIKAGYPPVSVIKVDGEIKKVYKLGELPDNFAEENPLYPGRPLRNGECDQTGRSWTGVPLSVRQLVRLVLLVVYKNKEDFDVVHNLIQLAVSPDAEKVIRDRYRQAAMEYDKLAELGNLPNLKVKLGKNSPYNCSLSGGTKVNWS